MSTLQIVLGVLFGLMVIYHAVVSIPLIGGWVAAVFIIAGVDIIISAVTGG